MKGEKGKTNGTIKNIGSKAKNFVVKTTNDIKDTKSLYLKIKIKKERF